MLISCCLGIDLGTTNSTIAYGSIGQNGFNPGQNGFNPHRVNDIRVNGTGAPGVKSLSSYSYNGNVTKILEDLIMGVNHRFQFLEEKPPSARLVITVPVCSGKRDDKQTAQAAENVSIDGALKNIQQIILLSEPHAALHYFWFCNSSTLNPINFSEPKLCLVFDLGGGTLDVSLHEVSENAGSLTIMDIAKSTCTGPCGDEFDKLVAEELLQTYHSSCSETFNDSEKKLLTPQFQKYAKEAKEQLGTGLSSQKTPSLFEKSLTSFSPTLLPDDYKKIITPFLGDCLNLTSPYNKSSIDIINPILYVLEEARKGHDFEGCDRPKVDVVLLNGGMTKLKIIRDRLEDFFDPGVVKQEAEFDPEGAVVMGAVVKGALSV